MEKNNASAREENLFHLDIHPQVFFTSAGVILFFVIVTLVFQQYVGNIFQVLQGAIAS